MIRLCNRLHVFHHDQTKRKVQEIIVFGTINNKKGINCYKAGESDRSECSARGTAPL